MDSLIKCYKKVAPCLIIGLAIFVFTANAAGAVFPTGLERAQLPDQSKAYENNELRNPNFREADSFIKDEIIVKFKDDSKPFRLVKIPKGKVGEKMEEFRSRKDVEYAEPNYLAHAFMVPNDPYYGYQWHLADINTGTAWDISNGSGTIVAVVDTGISRGTDLANTCFTTGYDFVNNDSNPADDNGHGTHVAGTVAQSTNNGQGVAGVAFGACLMSIKVLDRNGSGTYADVADGIYWAVDHGARVINLSLGGDASSVTLENAVAYAYNNGVTVVAAAGNDGLSSVSYPAAYDAYVIAVGATQYDENLAPYSNYGPSLDLVAPGGNNNLDQNGDGYADGVLQQTFEKRGWRYNWGYYFMSGTSMASPHVAAVAALLLSNGNASTSDEVRLALQETAKDKGANGFDETYGWGLIDAYAALQWTAGPVDNPPTVSILYPFDGAVISGTSTNITVTATDDIGVARVDFYVDNILIGSDSGDPYVVFWDSTAVSDGPYVIDVMAVDTASQTGSDSVNITVNNVNDPPVANAGSDQSAYVGDVVNFDGSGSYDPDGSIISYDWDFGDGAVASGVIVSHIYSSIGTSIVTLIITDNGGLTGQDTAIVDILEKPSFPAMHVSDITFVSDKKVRRQGDYCKVSATVSILDSSSAGVSNAAVYGSWSGAYNRNVSGLTNGGGTVSFQTGWVKNCGTFVFTVNNVVNSGWLYDFSANVETSDSITL